MIDLHRSFINMGQLHRTRVLVVSHLSKRKEIMTRLVITEALILLSTIDHRNQDIKNSLRVLLKIQVPFVHLHTVSKDVTHSAYACAH